MGCRSYFDPGSQVWFRIESILLCKELIIFGDNGNRAEYFSSASGMNGEIGILQAICNTIIVNETRAPPGKNISN